LSSIRRGFHVHRESWAPDDAHEQRRESIVVFGCIVRDRPDQWHILVLQTAADGIGQQLLRHGLCKQVAVARRELAQAPDAFERGAVVRDAGGIDRLAGIRSPPLADAVEIFHGEPQRLEDLVARGAVRVDAMGLHARAHGFRRFARDRGQIRIDSRRWLGRTDVEERFQKPLAPLDR